MGPFRSARSRVSRSKRWRGMYPDRQCVQDRGQSDGKAATETPDMSSWTAGETRSCPDDTNPQVKDVVSGVQIHQGVEGACKEEKST